jgi:acyl-coenzyme A thioesterase PaaI-like protein
MATYRDEAEMAFSPEVQLLKEVAEYPAISTLRDSSNIKEMREVMKIATEGHADNLTATTLATRNTLPIPPFVFVDDSRGSLHAFYYLGSGLAGHRGFLHGGMFAVLLDECMGRASFALLPNHIGMTVSLDIKYLAPIKIPGIVMIKATTEKVEGRKAWVDATIESSGGTVVHAQARALFIEPRGAAESMGQMI